MDQGSHSNVSDPLWMRQSIEHLLVATDLTHRSDRAMERAVELADQLEAQLTLLHVIDEGLPRRLATHRRREARAVLQEHLRALTPSADRDVSISIRTGEVCIEIAREAIELGSDAIILGTNAQRTAEHRRTGLAANVLRYSDRPIVVVKNQPAGPYRSALVCVDTSHDPARAVRAVSRLAPAAQSHVVDYSLSTASDLLAATELAECLPGRGRSSAIRLCGTLGSAIIASCPHRHRALSYGHRNSGRGSVGHRAFEA